MKVFFVYKGFNEVSVVFILARDWRKIEEKAFSIVVVHFDFVLYHLANKYGILNMASRCRSQGQFFGRGPTLSLRILQTINRALPNMSA